MTATLRSHLRVFALSLAVAAGVFAAQPAMSQELAPEHLALARKYVDLTDKSGLYEVTLVQTGIETMRTILAQDPDIADQVNTAVEQTLTFYKDRKGELMDQFARIYAQRLTEDELQQIVTFYESPVGEKLATINAEANRDLQAVMGVFSNNLRGEFYAKVKADLKAMGIEL